MFERSNFALITETIDQDESNLVELVINKGYQYIVLKNNKSPNYV